MFDDITINYTGTNERFWAFPGRKVIFGPNVNSTTSTGRYLSIVGGGIGVNAPIKDDGGDPQIIIWSGTYDFVTGGNRGAKINANPSITIYGGTFKKPIYGAGMFKGSDVEGDVNVTIYGGTFNHYVIAGGTDSSVTGDTYLKIYGGTFDSFVNGGGYQSSETLDNAKVYGNTNVTIEGGVFKSYVSGGSYNGTIIGNTNLEIHGGTFNNDVMGGGTCWQRSCIVDGDVNLKITGGDFNAIVFGGLRVSTGKSQYISGKVNVEISGGEFNQLFYGAGNGRPRDAVYVEISGGTFHDNIIIVYAPGFEKDTQNKEVYLKFKGDSFKLNPKKEAGKIISCVHDSSAGAVPADKSTLDLSEVTGDINELFAGVTMSAPTSNLGFKKVYQPLNNITSIKLERLPSKTNYIIGEDANLSGMEIKVNYSQGFKFYYPDFEIIKYDEYIQNGNPNHFVIEPEIMDSADIKTLNVSYGGKSVTIPVIVDTEPLVLKSIEIKEFKTSYFEGSMIDTSSLILAVSYENKDRIDYVQYNDEQFELSIKRPLESTDTSVTISYTLNGKKISVEVPIKVSKRDVVYISDDGIGDGSSPEFALKGTVRYPYVEGSILHYYQNSALYQAAELLKDTGGTIVICGEVFIGKEQSYGSGSSNRDFRFPQHSKKIKITSKYAGVDYRVTKNAKLIIETPAQIELYGETEWENLEICTSGTDRAIICNNNKTVFGQGIECTTLDGKPATPANASYFISIAGGRRFSGSSAPESTDLTVMSGTYNKLVGGIWGFYGVNPTYLFIGNTNLTVGGNTKVLNGVVGGCNDSNAYIAGNVNINITGGTFYGMITGTNKHGFANKGATTWIKISGGNFTNCSGIYSSYKGGVTYNHPYTSVLDFSSYNSEDYKDASKVLSDLYEITSSNNTENFNKVYQPGQNPGPAIGDKIDANVESMRSAVVDYMREMASIEWEPEETFTLKSEGANSYKLVYKAGEKYYGLPYTNKQLRAFEIFKSYIEDGIYKGPVDIDEVKGNNCSSSILDAWSQISNSVSARYTQEMIPSMGKGVIAVGEYDLSAYNQNTKTEEVTVANGEQVMYQAYALLKPADAIVTHNVNAGHARLISKDAVVVNNQDGTIDGENSYITVIEQTSSFDASVNTTYRVDRTYTFKQLFDTGYLPVTCSELATGKVDQVNIIFTGTGTASRPADRIADGVIYSNYDLFGVSVVLKNERGDVVYTVTKYPLSKPGYFSMEDFFSEISSAISALPDGSYTSTTTAYAGNKAHVLDTFSFTLRRPVFIPPVIAPTKPAEKEEVKELTIPEMPNVRKDKVIFIKDGGTGDGSSPEKAMGAKIVIPYDENKVQHYYQNSVLYQAMDKLKITGGTVVICGEVKIGKEVSYGSGFSHREYRLPQNGSNAIKITSVYDGVDYRKTNNAKLIVEAPAQIEVNGVIVWENLEISTNGKDRAIICNNYLGYFGEGIECTTVNGLRPTADNASEFIGIAGSRRFSGSTGEDSTNIVVLSGTYNKIAGGLWGFASQNPLFLFKGETNVAIGGTTTVLGGVIGGCNETNTYQEGNVNIIITGGTFYGPIEGTNKLGFKNSNATVKISISDGDFSNCPGIYGSCREGVAYNQPETSIADLSYLTADKYNALSRKLSKLFSEVIAPSDKEEKDAEYKVYYDGNGNTSGSAPKDDKAYKAGEFFVVSRNTGKLLKDGYVFDGWNTKPDGTGVDYKAGAKIKLNSDITLYAKWVPFQPKISFVDIPANEWYSEAVNFLAEKDIVSPTGSNRFAPNDNVTRADFLIMIMKAYEIEPYETIQDNFADAGNKYYTNYLGTAKRLGIVQGVGNNNFLPEASATREDMFVMLYRVMNKLGKIPAKKDTNTLNDFIDADIIASYAKDALKSLVEAGIVKGTGNRINPKHTCTRAEAAQLIYNILNQ